jgi:hypothetical protein
MTKNVAKVQEAILENRKTVSFVRIEFFMAVTMKNAIFWYDTPCGSCKNQFFGGMYRLHHQGDKNWLARNNIS